MINVEFNRKTSNLLNIFSVSKKEGRNKGRKSEKRNLKT